MADAQGSSSHQLEHEVEQDVPEVELEHDEAELEGDEVGGTAAGSNALEGLGGETPSGAQAVIAKLLISNAAAGSVIGKVSVAGARVTMQYCSVARTLGARCANAEQRHPVLCRVARPLSRYRRTLVHACSCPGRASSTQVRCAWRRQLHDSCRRGSRACLSSVGMQQPWLNRLG